MPRYSNGIDPEQHVDLIRVACRDLGLPRRDWDGWLGEGWLALESAARYFDPGRHGAARWSTYATTLIRQRLRRAIRQERSPLGLRPRGRSRTAALRPETRRARQAAEAPALGFDEPAGDTARAGGLTLADVLACDTQALDVALGQRDAAEAVCRAVAELRTEREREIAIRVVLGSDGVKAVARERGVSHQAISQVSARLRRVLANRLHELVA